MRKTPKPNPALSIYLGKPEQSQIVIAYIDSQVRRFKLRNRSELLRALAEGRLIIVRPSPVLPDKPAHE